MSDYAFENWTSDELTRIQTGINLRRPSDHQSLFKYISLDSETSWQYLQKTLHDLELVGATASSLNDPFELSPVVFDDLAPNTIADAVRYNNLADRLLGRPEKPLMEVFPDSTPYRRQAYDYLERMGMRYRIISFCERADSGLLWSHYSNSYQGACLHFLAKGFRQSWHHTFGYVKYSKYRPTYPLSLALSLAPPLGHPRQMGSNNATPVKRSESEQLLFFTKAEDWNYESEIRLIYDSKERDAVKFHQDSLVSVIMGPRFSDESRQRLKKIISESKYNNLPVRQARLSKTTFSVEIDAEHSPTSAP